MAPTVNKHRPALPGGSCFPAAGPRLLTALTVSALAFGISAAQAGEWTIDPRISIEESYTDNVRSTSNGREGDWLTTTAAGLRISGKGARAEVFFDGEIAHDEYLDTAGLSGERINVLGKGTAELYENVLFVDASIASVVQDIARSGAISGIDRSQSSNQTQVTNYTFSPYVKNRFGNWADSELRYSFSGVMYDQTSTSNTPSPSSDAVTHRFSGDVTSGQRFRRLLWSLNADHTLIDRKSSNDFESTTVEARGEYVLTRRISLLGRLGYETIDDNSSVDISGLTWRAGARFTPGPRTEARLEIGRRFDDTILSGDFSYQVDEKTFIKAIYEETISTQQGALNDQLAGFIIDDQGQLVDPSTGLPADPASTNLDQTDNTFRQKDLKIVFSGVRMRNRFNLTSFLTERKFDIDNTDETIYGVQGFLNRQLSRRLDGEIRASYSKTTDPRNAGGKDAILRAGLSFGYDFSQTFRGTLAYDYLNRDNESGTGQMENVFSLRLRKTF